MEMQSLEIGKLAEALSKAQMLIKGAKEDCKNPYFKSDYADLTSVWKACRAALTENGIAICQTMDTEQERIVLVTTLLHASGQWIKSKLPVILTKNDPQTLGSSLTYTRRYALAAIAGVCPMGEDDDGEEAMRDSREKSIKDNKQNGLSDKQCAMLDSYLQEDQEAIPKICKSKGLKSVYDLDPEHFDGVISTLKQRKEKRDESRVA